MDHKFQTAAKTNILISAPRKPWRKGRIKQLSAILADLDEVREAHLPLVIEIGSPAPAALALFVVIEPESATAAVVGTIQSRLPSVLRRGETLDVRPIGRHDELLATIRDVNCVIGWRD